MEDFVTFEMAKKLKDIGFECKHPFAMYNENGIFHALFTSADYYTCKSGKYREYYAIEDFDEYNYICPTISQALEWLRDEKRLYVEPCILADADTDADDEIINEYIYWSFSITNIETGDMIYFEYEQHIDDKRFDSYEEAAMAGIKYIIDNLI